MAGNLPHATWRSKAPSTAGACTFVRRGRVAGTRKAAAPRTGEARIGSPAEGPRAHEHAGRARAYSPCRHEVHNGFATSQDETPVARSVYDKSSFAFSSRK